MKKLSILFLLALVFQPLLQGSAARFAVVATPNTYDDRNLTVFAYTGTWTNTVAASAYKSSHHVSSVLNSEATFSFSGDHFDLIYTAGPSFRMLGIYVDTVLQTTLNQNRATIAYQQRWHSPTYTDATHTVRLVHASGSYVSVDGIQVFGPPDLIFPDSITDLVAGSGPSGGTATLNWSAPGDDGAVGTASAYLVRYSTSAISNETLWNAATATTINVPAPAVAGTPQTMTVVGLSPGLTYYFAVRARDDGFNLGGLSNSVSATALASTPLAAGTHENTSANLLYAGTWTISNSASASGGNYRVSSVLGNSIGFMFNGTDFQVGYATSSKYGKLDVYVDGAKVGTITQTSTLAGWKKTWQSGAFTNGTHSVLLVHASGSKANLDFIKVNLNIPLIWPTISTQFVVGGFSSPVLVTHAGDGSGRIFIVEQPGVIQIYDGVSVNGTPFLDITGRVDFNGERGLLSMAFPPNYSTSGHFYVFYTDNGGDLILSRFGLTGNPDVADDTSEQIVLTIEHSANTNHNGGHLAFGPDGFLYFSSGDGGGSGDPAGNGQNLNTRLGKILRLDVNTNISPYYLVPPSNPFVGISGDDLIWAYGLRNPWRFSFDRLTGDLFIGDVGQSAWEEVDFQPAGFVGGANYGWRILEGKHCYSPSSGCVAPAGYVAPVAEYSHSLGCSITGGYVYRGSTYASMQGYYFYSDYCTGRIWGLQRVGGTWFTTQLMDTAFNVSSFGEDEAGNLYLVNLGGSIYEVVAP